MGTRSKLPRNRDSCATKEAGLQREKCLSCFTCVLKALCDHISSLLWLIHPISFPLTSSPPFMPVRSNLVIFTASQSNSFGKSAEDKQMHYDNTLKLIFYQDFKHNLICLGFWYSFVPHTLACVSLLSFLWLMWEIKGFFSLFSSQTSIPTLSFLV